MIIKEKLSVHEYEQIESILYEHPYLNGYLFAKVSEDQERTDLPDDINQFIEILIKNITKAYEKERLKSLEF